MESYSKTERLSSGKHLDLLIGEQLAYWRFVLRVDEIEGSYSNGDVDVHPPALWPSWTDNHFWELNDPDESERELLEYEEEARTDILDAEYDDEAMRELRSEGARLEFEAWLDGLAPPIEEIELRGAWGGHPAETA